MKNLMTFESMSAPYRELSGEDDLKYSRLVSSLSDNDPDLRGFDSPTLAYVRRVIALALKNHHMKGEWARLMVTYHNPVVRTITWGPKIENKLDFPDFPLDFPLDFLDDSDCVLTLYLSNRVGSGNTETIYICFLDDDYLYVQARRVINSRVVYDNSFICDDLRGLSTLVDHLNSL
jgi:hypothetical protein